MECLVCGKKSRPNKIFSMGGGGEICWGIIFSADTALPSSLGARSSMKVFKVRLKRLGCLFLTLMYKGSTMTPLASSTYIDYVLLCKKQYDTCK